MLKIKIDFKSFIQRGIKPINEDFFIRMITGYQGSGKSYLAIKFAHQNEDNSRKIKTNIKSYYESTKTIEYFDKIEDIVHDNDDNITYIIDEVSKKYNKESKIDKPFYSWLQQSRKHNRHVYLITQEYIQVPTWLRGIANTIYTTSKVPLLPIYKSILGTPYLDENCEWSINEFLVIYYKRTRSIASLYDTRESIDNL